MDYTLKERFLRYVQVDTEADPFSTSSPSSEKQKDLSKILVSELHEMNVMDASMNEFGYVIAEIPGQVDHQIPGIFFCAHIDTAPDVSGKDVKPIVHSNYQGQEIVLPDDPDQIVGPKKYPQLLNKIGHDIITASGTTLLGSDDKSGLAIIMDVVYQLMNSHADKTRGPVSVVFTTDEEVGRGVAHVDIDAINAVYGFTLDGGDIGDYADENFSADGIKLIIKGLSAHPGYAKGKMQHAMKIAARFLAAMPTETLTPEVTSGKEGFIHPSHIEGGLEQTTVEFIIRDFDTNKLDDHVALIEKTIQEILLDFPDSSYELIREEQYRNMKDVIDQHPHINEIALAAMERAGVTAKHKGIRGGTDGAVLSHAGLPCPNLFAGEQGVHSRTEWTSVQDMQKSVDTVLNIIEIHAETFSN